MNNLELQEAALKISELEKQCQQGTNLSENLKIIEEIASKFSVSDLLKLDELIEKNLTF